MHLKNNQELVEHLKDIGVLQDPKIISSFENVDRASFVKPEDKKFAYEDIPLSIGYGQTISQPLTVAFMLEKLEPKKGAEILDIGSGSGWTTALLAQIVGPNGMVIGLELIHELVEFGRLNLQKYKLSQAKIEKGEKSVLGRSGRVFDKILVSASAEKMPEELFLQLKPNGILVIPVKNSVFKVTKNLGRIVGITEFPGFTFVPLLSSGDLVYTR